MSEQVNQEGYDMVVWSVCVTKPCYLRYLWPYLTNKILATINCDLATTTNYVVTKMTVRAKSLCVQVFATCHLISSYCSKLPLCGSVL